MAVDNVGRYVAGDLRGSLGAWFSGRWHTPGNGAYAGRIEWRLDERNWITDQLLPSHP